MSLDQFSGGSSHLPSQRVTDKERTEDWKRSSVNYYINFRYTNGTNLRSDRANKIVNYDLANGRVTLEDVRKVCDPMGDSTATFQESFMHMDKISPIIHELLGEESIKPDTSLVYSEAADDISRKTESLKGKISESLKRLLMAEIDPSTVDPNNPPPTPEQIVKLERSNPSDTLEAKANKILKILKKKLNTKILLNQGFKDALIAGEEIYWTGILNGEPAARRCNPLNMTVIMDDSDVFIDEAIAVIEERLLTIPSIMDEYGDELTAKDMKTLESYANGVFGTFNSTGGFTPIFNVVQGQNVLGGVTPSSSATGNNSSNFSLRVTRVEWMGMKQVGTLSYTDTESGEQIEKLIDESFKSLFKDFKAMYPDAEVEWFWVNEAWEGVKIGQDIYLGIRAKPNQRRRMDNPYYSKLGYTGFLYEATNSKSVSIVDRLKSYQYLYDIISWKLQLVFGSDIGKVMLMDLAQIPRSEGIDLQQWMYYFKEMKIAFLNSFEEGKKGVAQGKLSNFNQFQSIDMSLSQSVQQYMNYLDFIDRQIYNVSGVSQQRLGKIHQDEAVANVQQATSQSETQTQYLFDAHQEVKRRFYTSIIEVAKIAWRKGMVTQYVNDDLTLEILKLEEFEFENSEFAVFVSNLDKDKMVKAKLDQLAQVAMEQQKVDLSGIIDTVLNDSPKEIINLLKKAEADFYQRQQDNQKAEQEHNAQMAQAQQEHEQIVWAHEAEEKQKDRASSEYIAESNNRTKIEVQELANYFQMSDMDADKNGVPDAMEIANNALAQQELSIKSNLEQQKIHSDRDKNNREHERKSKELASKIEIEKLKIKAIETQNKSQEKIAKESNRLKEKEIAVKKIAAKRKPSGK